MTQPEGLEPHPELDARYRQLVELAPDGILIHDGGRIVLANTAAVHLAGATTSAELVGLSIETFLDPPYLKGMQIQVTASGIAAELAPPVRDIFRRLDGTALPVEVRAVAFMDQGRPSAHVVIRDISERLATERAAQQLNERLQHMQRMESVGALAGGVAHEVNNMMQVVLGFSEFLRKDVRLPTECQADVREIQRAAECAATITRQLLAFSRRAVHRPQVVELGAAVREAEPVIQRLLGEERRLVLIEHATPKVWVDPGQLQQVLINLGLNARDAMPSGGTLTITTSETELGGDVVAADGARVPAGRYAVLVVQDTGSGIDPAIREQIFEPFFTTKALGNGTGLGLAAVHGILTQNAGYITVTSAPEHGATFTVYLSALSATTVVEPRRDSTLPAVSGRRATVLVVDDENAVRQVAVRILERGGFHVIQAPDGMDALELIERQGPPDLVLTDLMMPRIGGAELARRLKERWPGVRILFMSGYSAEHLHRKDAIVADGTLISKPFTPDALVASVAAALSA